MPKINQKEYETLKRMQKKGHKFIARRKEGHVIVFTAYHGKSENRWLVTTNRDDYKYESLYNSDEIFLFIGWEDEEPYSIAELIEEYEEEPDLKEQMSVAMDRLEEKCGIAMKEIRRVFGGSRLESEETEVTKDIEWLKDEVFNQNLINKDGYIYAGDLTRLLNQLDEPEVLSSDWIDKKRLINRVENYIPLHDKTVGDVINGILEIIKQLPELEVLSPEWIDENQHPYGGDYHVPSEKLEDILVPKQEEITHKQVEKYLLDKNIRVIDIDIYEEMQSELEELKNGVTLSKTETVADVIADFFKSLERLKEVMSMEVEELEE